MTAKARVLHRGVAVAETSVSLEAGKENVAVLDVVDCGVGMGMQGLRITSGRCKGSDF